MIAPVPLPIEILEPVDAAIPELAADLVAGLLLSVVDSDAEDSVE